MNSAPKFVWDTSLGAAESAREALPAMAGLLFERGRAIAAGSPRTKDLHAFRLEVKRFRYTFEIFRPLYGAAAENRLASLRRLQQHLGGVNDCATARRLLRETGSKRSTRIRKLIGWLEEREREVAGKSLEYWRETFDAPGEREKWVTYLRVHAGRAGKRPAGAASSPEKASAADVV
jgi:hypothetical protein